MTMNPARGLLLTGRPWHGGADARSHGAGL